MRYSSLRRSDMTCANEGSHRFTCHPAPLPQKKGQSPQFSAHFYCGQTAGCIKMPLGMKVGLSPVDFVLDGDPVPPQKVAEPPIFGLYFQPHSITALWLVLISRPTEGRRLSWPGWFGVILRCFARPKMITHPCSIKPWFNVEIKLF